MGRYEQEVLSLGSKKSRCEGEDVKYQTVQEIAAVSRIELLRVRHLVNESVSTLTDSDSKLDNESTSAVCLSGKEQAVLAS